MIMLVSEMLDVTPIMDDKAEEKYVIVQFRGLYALPSIFSFRFVFPEFILEG